MFLSSINSNISTTNCLNKPFAQKEASLVLNYSHRKSDTLVQKLQSDGNFNFNVWFHLDGGDGFDSRRRAD